MIYNPFYYNSFIPFIPPNCDKPPTLYSILESLVNYGKEDKTKIKDLAKVGRQYIFDFDYDLTEKVDKAKFEETILNHFLMRRIGFDTVTAFKIQLKVKLDSMLPVYNKMLELVDETVFFGDTQIRDGYDNTDGTQKSNSDTTLKNSSSTKSENISDRRFSDTPENRLGDVRAGKYITDYNYDTANANATDESNGNSKTNTNQETTNNKKYHETVTNVNMIDTLLKMKELNMNVYQLIFHDLDELFYQLI